MPKRSNGYSGSREKCAVLSTEFVDIATTGFQENSRIEASLKRRKSLPSIKRLKMDSTGDMESISEKGKRCFPDFIRGCSVKLIRDDLEQLKVDVLTNSRANQTWAVVSSGNIKMPIYKCKICAKAYCTEKRLQKHQANKHMLAYQPQKPQKRVSFSDHIMVHELTDNYPCRKCTEIFEDCQSLKTHMKLMHKKYYVCNYCTKNFVDRMYFKLHIKLHCDMCGKLFPNQFVYKEHRQTVCKVVNKYRCKICRGAFFRLMDLKDHSYEHLEEMFICDICKDQFETKCAILHHIAYLHSEQRPKTIYITKNLGTERMYFCRYCNLTTVDRVMIDHHVSVLPDLRDEPMKTYGDYYFCDRCLMKFDGELCMMQHMVSQHVKICQSSRLRKNRTRSTRQRKMKWTYKVWENIPDCLQPKILIERMEMDAYLKSPADKVKYRRLRNVNVTKKATASPERKRTTRYQCKTCNNFFSTCYCLTRHIVTVHVDHASLRCDICDETFIWPSHLQSHKCNTPAPDAQCESYQDFGSSGLYELMNISASEDYLNTLDFEIPAPLGAMIGQRYDDGQNLGYTIVMQEV